VNTQGKILEQQAKRATQNAQNLSRDSDKLNSFLENNSKPPKANSITLSWAKKKALN
jgi:hypothetical protein